MSRADDEDRQLARNPVEDAGGVNPLDGLLVAALPEDRLRVVMSFENENQAILELAGKPGKYVLSALTTGPVLPETC